MKVYVVIYTHKHGMDCAVYATDEIARRAVHHLMFERADQSWDRGDWAKFQASDYDQQVDLFHEVEKNVSYGEVIELLEREVQ